MQARMKNPALIIPGALEALQALAKAAEKGGVPRRTVELVHLHISQIKRLQRLRRDVIASSPEGRSGSQRPLLGVSLAGRWVLYGCGTRPRWLSAKW